MMTDTSKPHSEPTLNERKDEIVREWMDVAGEIGNFKALDGLATAFVAMERQAQRTQEQLESLRLAAEAMLSAERNPRDLQRELRAALDASSPAKRPSSARSTWLRGSAMGPRDAAVPDSNVSMRPH